MSQILKNLQFVTQSFTGTPETGTGVMFASSSRIYFENASGNVFPLGGPGYLVVREYTGSAPGGGTINYTWYKPDNLKYLQVVCVGAGGGGRVPGPSLNLGGSKGSDSSLTSAGTYGTVIRATGGGGGGGSNNIPPPPPPGSQGLVPGSGADGIIIIQFTNPP